MFMCAHDWAIECCYYPRLTLKMPPIDCPLWGRDVLRQEAWEDGEEEEMSSLDLQYTVWNIKTYYVII